MGSVLIGLDRYYARKIIELLTISITTFYDEKIWLYLLFLELEIIAEPQFKPEIVLFFPEFSVFLANKKNGSGSQFEVSNRSIKQFRGQGKTSIFQVSDTGERRSEIKYMKRLFLYDAPIKVVSAWSKGTKLG